jgi:hypothetical protein
MTAATDQSSLELKADIHHNHREHGFEEDPDAGLSEEERREIVFTHGVSYLTVPVLIGEKDRALVRKLDIKLIPWLCASLHSIQ